MIASCTFPAGCCKNVPPKSCVFLPLVCQPHQPGVAHTAAEPFPACVCRSRCGVVSWASLCMLSCGACLNPSSMCAVASVCGCVYHMGNNDNAAQPGASVHGVHQSSSLRPLNPTRGGEREEWCSTGCAGVWRCKEVRPECRQAVPFQQAGMWVRRRPVESRGKNQRCCGPCGVSNLSPLRVLRRCCGLIRL